MNLTEEKAEIAKLQRELAHARHLLAIIHATAAVAAPGEANRPPEHTQSGGPPQVKLGTALARAYGHVQEALLDGYLDSGLPRGALWQAYATRVPNATQKSFSTLIDKLVTKGLLVQRFEGDQQVLTLPKGSPLLA